MDLLLTALILLAAATAVILTAKHIASHIFRCKHCSGEFRINWTKVLVTEHSGSEYRLVCPFCKIKDWCSEQTKHS